MISSYSMVYQSVAYWVISYDHGSYPATQALSASEPRPTWPRRPRRPGDPRGARQGSQSHISLSLSIYICTYIYIYIYTCICIYVYYTHIRY